jgi:hypothetical protein
MRFNKGQFLPSLCVVVDVPRQGAMSTFYFHLLTPDGVERDDIGIELVGIEDAQREARQAIPEIAASLLREGRNPMQCSFSIEGEAGRISTILPFQALVKARAD